MIRGKTQGLTGGKLRVYPLHMIYATITLILLMTALIIINLRQYFLYINARSRLTSFFASPGKDAEKNELPSEFATVLDFIAGVGAQRLAGSLKATLMQSDGAVKRQESALKIDYMKEILNGTHPMASMLLDMVPKSWVKRIADNPTAAVAAFDMLKNSGAAGTDAKTAGPTAAKNGSEYATY